MAFKKHMQEIVNTANIGFITISLGKNLKIIKINNGLVALLGYSKDELNSIFKSLDKLFFNPEDLVKFYGLLKNKLKRCECVLRKKDGSSINVLIKKQGFSFGSRKKLMLCQVHDQTSAQTDKKITEMFNDIFFKYNIQTRTLYSSKNLGEEIKPVNTDCDLFLFFKGKVHPADRQKWVHMYEKLISEKKHVKSKLRLAENPEQYSWYMVELSPVLDEKGKIVSIAGKASDINEIIEETEQFKEKAMRDPLTGFYNKNATAELINEYLAGEGKDKVHSMLFIDIDNFKYINDTLGHLFGDKVLIDISEKIKKMFRSTDLVGRIGGDEFVILIKETGSLKTTYDKVEHIRRIFDKVYHHNNVSYNITGSIGVAIYPQNGTTYEELIKNADDALYIAKSKGKNQFAVYSGKGRNMA
ncbi:MAG TPA: sensor domain-containing diguanylate cyclase [Clostridiales bacterium]|nr:sensor domain-containing diguanylate cyclase [Clostridiales bacterium]